MIKKFFVLLIIFLFSKSLSAVGYDVYSVGFFDVKFDGSATNTAADKASRSFGSTR